MLEAFDRIAPCEKSECVLEKSAEGDEEDEDEEEDMVRDGASGWLRVDPGTKSGATDAGAVGRKCFG